MDKINSISQEISANYGGFANSQPAFNTSDKVTFSSSANVEEAGILSFQQLNQKVHGTTSTDTEASLETADKSQKIAEPAENANEEPTAAFLNSDSDTTEASQGAAASENNVKEAQGAQGAEEADGSAMAIAELEARKKELEEQIKELEEKEKLLEEEQKELERLQTELDELNKQLEAARKDGDEEKEKEISNKMQQAGQKLDNTQQSVESNQRQANTIQDNVGQAQNRVNQAQQQVQAQQNAGAAQSQGNTQAASGATNISLGNASDQEVASFIDNFLAEKGSPAAGSGAGAMMVKYGKEYGVDPIALLAIAGQETQWGQTGIGVNGMLGVGAYDDDPNNATRNSAFSGVEMQIKKGAQTFANLREKGGATADSPMSEQLAAVNSAGWATDTNWHNGVNSIYNSIMEKAGETGLGINVTSAGAATGVTGNTQVADWGARIAADGAANPMGGEGGWCLAGVAQILNRNGIHGAVSGQSAYQAADSLANSEAFNEVSGYQESDLPNLPAGAIVVYDRGNGHEHGHIFMSLGNGQEVSDLVRPTTQGYGTSFRVFMPNPNYQLN